MGIIEESSLHFSMDVLGVLIVLYIIPWMYGHKVVWKNVVCFDKNFFNTLVGKYSITLFGIILYYKFIKTSKI